MKTALYRHFDAHGVLLYVGISMNALQRTEQHRKTAGWFEEIAQIQIEWFATRDLAEMAEKVAIAREKPRHNISRPKLCESAASKQRYAIFHPASQRVDGWYRHAADALDVLGYFREELPRERFELLAHDEEKISIWFGRKALRLSESPQWAKSH